MVERTLEWRTQAAAPGGVSARAWRSQCRIQPCGISATAMGTVGTAALQNETKQFHFLKAKHTEGLWMFLAMAFFEFDS